MKFSEITGYSADELLAIRIPDITHPDDRQDDWEAFQSVVRGEASSYRKEKRYVRKDGSLTWVNVKRDDLARCVRPTDAQRRRDPGYQRTQTE